MTFEEKIEFFKSDKNELELLRFCNKLNTNVIGGASKLFKDFVNNYNIEKLNIISYADRCWSNGEIYEKLGFDFLHKTIPNYWYIVDGIKRHRLNYTKKKLVALGHDKNKTEKK